MAHISLLSSSQVKDEAISDLLTARFGARGDQRELIAMWRTDERRVVLVATEQEADHDPLALCIARLNEPADFEPLRVAFGLTPQRAPLGSYGSFQLLACSPAHQQRGLGGALATRALAWLTQRGASVFVGVSWEHGGPDHSGHLFERGGFERVASSDRFYQEGQAISGQRCPRCDTPRCRCIAHLYMLTC